MPPTLSESEFYILKDKAVYFFITVNKAVATNYWPLDSRLWIRSERTYLVFSTSSMSSHVSDSARESEPTSYAGSQYVEANRMFGKDPFRCNSLIRSTALF